jgi:periplasmic mercuric ion binding protein
MNKSPLALLVALALAVAARAESTVKLSDVHLCCKSCVTGAEKAVGKVSGATITCDADAGSATVSASDTATAQRAVDSLVAAGYFGKSGNPEIMLKDTSGAKDAKVSKLAVNDVHLCCKKCVTAVTKAIGSVKGVTGNNAEKGAKTFEVTGDFSPKEVFAALQNVGLTGKAGN